MEPTHTPPSSRDNRAKCRVELEIIIDAAADRGYYTMGLALHDFRGNHLAKTMFFGLDQFEQDTPPGLVAAACDYLAAAIIRTAALRDFIASNSHALTPALRRERPLGEVDTVRDALSW